MTCAQHIQYMYTLYLEPLEFAVLCTTCFSSDSGTCMSYCLVLLFVALMGCILKQVYLLLLKWPILSPEDALELLHYKYADIAVRLWAVKCLEVLR